MGAAVLGPVLVVLYAPGSGAVAALLLIQVAPLAWPRVAPFAAAVAVAVGCLLQLVAGVEDAGVPVRLAVRAGRTTCPRRWRWTRRPTGWRTSR